jgi:hypothetical protein
MPKMSSHYPFAYLKHKLWPKEGPKIKFAKILTKVTTFLQSAFQLEVCTQSYGPPKSWESQFKEFQDSNLGVTGQNDIWVLVLWPSIKNTIRGKVVASPKSRLWWVLWVCVCMWVHGCPWLICAPKVLQLYINQLVDWFVQVHVSNLLVCHSS